MSLGTTKTNPGTQPEVVPNSDGAPTVAVIKTDPATAVSYTHLTLPTILLV